MSLLLGRPLLLDSGPLGQIARRRRPPEIDAWFRDALVAGAQFVLPEIADYETRRNYRTGRKAPGFSHGDIRPVPF